MAFSYRVLETKLNGSNLSSYDSDDVSAWTLSPGANTVLVVTAAVADTTATEPTTPTISGLSLTWNEIDADIFFDDRCKGSVWWAAIGGTPPSSGVYTVDYSGDTQERWASTVVEITGADGTEFVRLVTAVPNEAAATGTSVSPSATTPNSPAGGNAIMGICFWEADNETFSPGTSFTELFEEGFGASRPAEAGEWDTTPADGTADGTITASKDWGMLAFEIKAGAAVPDAPTGLTEDVGTDDRTVGLSWTDVATDEDDYTIQRKQGAGSFESIPYTVDLDAAAGTWINTPNHADYGITGDLELGVLVALDDWTPAAACVIFGHGDYYLELRTDGKLEYHWHDTSVWQSEISSVATGFTDATFHWLKVTHDVDNGASDSAVRFYYANDVTVRLDETPTWVQLGTIQLLGSTTTRRVTSNPLRLGAQYDGSARCAAFATVGYIKDGIDGTLKAHFNARDLDGWNVAQTIYTDGYSRAWTLAGNAAVEPFPANTAAYTDRWAPSDVSLTYRVRCSNASGDSGWSSEEAVSTAPARPSNTVVGSPGGPARFTTLRVTWTDNTSGSYPHAILYREDGSGDPYNRINVAAATTQWDVPNLDSATAYDTTVIAYNGALESGRHTDVTATTNQSVSESVSDGIVISDVSATNVVVSESVSDGLVVSDSEVSFTEISISLADGLVISDSEIDEVALGSVGDAEAGEHRAALLTERSTAKLIDNEKQGVKLL